MNHAANTFAACIVVMKADIFIYTGTVTVHHFL